MQGASFSFMVIHCTQQDTRQTRTDYVYTCGRQPDTSTRFEATRRARAQSKQQRQDIHGKPSTVGDQESKRQSKNRRATIRRRARVAQPGIFRAAALQLQHLFLVGLQEFGRPSFRWSNIAPTFAVAAKRMQVLLPGRMLA